MAEATKKESNAPKKTEQKEVFVVSGDAPETPVTKLEKEKQNIFERLAPIKDQAILLSNLRKDRDALNARVKDLSEEVRAVKAQRDDLNQNVRTEKNKRDEINKQASDLRKDFKKDFGDQNLREGTIELQKLRKMVKDLRWKIETTGFSFEEEKKQRKKLDELEKRLSSLEKFDNARLGVVRHDRSAREFHSNVIDLSKKSEEVHQKLIVLYESLKQAREKADGKHNEVVGALDTLKQLELKHETDIKRLEELRGEILETREELEEQKIEESHKSAKERGAEAFAEFQKGGRVDLRDLQLRYMGDDKGKAREQEGAGAGAGTSVPIQAPASKEKKAE